MVQPFSFEKTDLNGVFLVNPFYAEDNRGGFTKIYNVDVFNSSKIKHPIKEIFYATSKKGVIRGIHFQLGHQQSKLVRCVSGKIYDVVVDLNPDSSTYGKWQGFELTGKNRKQLYIPEYCGHGYLVLEDSIVSYVCSEVFYKDGDSGIMWNDPKIAIDWPLDLIGGADNLILSEKDKSLMSFDDYSKLIKS